MKTKTITTNINSIDLTIWRSDFKDPIIKNEIKILFSIGNKPRQLTIDADGQCDFVLFQDFIAYVFPISGTQGIPSIILKNAAKAVYAAVVNRDAKKDMMNVEIRTAINSLKAYCFEANTSFEHHGSVSPAWVRAHFMPAAQQYHAA
jgi:hypothetical protein